MAKRLFLASFDYLRPKDDDISLAASSILAHLMKQFESSEAIQIFHRQYNVRRAEAQLVTDKFLQDVSSIKPDILATGIYVWNENYVCNAFDRLDTGRGIGIPSQVTTILGGPQITYNPKVSMQCKLLCSNKVLKHSIRQSTGFYVPFSS
jgi:hypothetical protein